MQITRHTHVPTLRLQGPTPPPTPQPPEEPTPEAGESRFWPGVGGFAAGLGAGAASGAAGLLLSGQVGRVIDATMPALANLPSSTLPVALLTASAVTIGAVAAAGISAVVGAKIAVGAARGDEKPDMTDNLQSNAAKKASPYAQNSAELRENLQGVQTAQSFKQAAASGFRAGATLAGPAGAASGKVQTALFGAMLGCAAALPLVALTGTNWAMIPGALGGALLGQKIGEPAGHAAASLVMGGLGAAGACAYHAFNRPEQA
jgi:hypothetical protein